MEKELIVAVSKLVAFLVANVSKDSADWHEWGLPFICLVLVAQFGKEEGERLLQEFDAQFCPQIGQGIHFMLEECSSTDFVIVHPADEFVNTIVDSLDIPSHEFDSILSKFLHNIFDHMTKLNTYDSRSRSIVRRMCLMLNVSAKNLSQIEQDQWSSSDSGLEVAVNNQNYSARFNSGATNINRSSLLAPFRLWRVAFIAAGGGAVMAVASRLAAPTVLETMVGLFCASTSVGQVSLAINAVLGCVGLTSAAFPYVLGGGLGATTAGYRMLKRTDRLKEFILEPLHVPHCTLLENSTLLIENSSGRGGAFGQSSSSNSGAAAALAVTKRECVPVFIVVSGHISRGVDPRSVWGANGTVASTKTSSIKTVSKVGEEGNEKTAGEEKCMDIDVHQARIIRKLVDEAAEQESGGSDTNETNETSSSSNLKIEDSEHLSEWEELRCESNGWWCDVVLNGDEYILHWEREILASLNESFQRMLAEKFRLMLRDEVVNLAVRGAVFLPLQVMARIRELDDPWVVAMDRARQAGVMLARVLVAEHSNAQRQATQASTATSTGTGGSGGLSTAVQAFLGSQPRKQHRSVSQMDAYFQHEVETFVQEYGHTLHRSAQGTSSDTSGSGTARPVTLVGYGMGARLIFHCLEELARLNARGIVESAVLIGTPVGSEVERWHAARSVVADRLINCYATNDWVLAILYRCKSYEFGVAGLAPVHLKPRTLEQMAGELSQGRAATKLDGEEIHSRIKWEEALRMRTTEVENVDVSHLITTHSDYPSVLPNIISMLRL